MATDPEIPRCEAELDSALGRQCPNPARDKVGGRRLCGVHLRSAQRRNGYRRCDCCGSNLQLSAYRRIPGGRSSTCTRCSAKLLQGATREQLAAECSEPDAQAPRDLPRDDRICWTCSNLPWRVPASPGQCCPECGLVHRSEAEFARVMRELGRDA